MIDRSPWYKVTPEIYLPISTLGILCKGQIRVVHPFFFFYGLMVLMNRRYIDKCCIATCVHMSGVHCVCCAVDRHSHRRSHRAAVLWADPREARHSRRRQGDLLRHHQRSHAGHWGVQKLQGCDHLHPWRQQNGKQKLILILVTKSSFTLSFESTVKGSGVVRVSGFRSQCFFFFWFIKDNDIPKIADFPLYNDALTLFIQPFPALSHLDHWGGQACTPWCSVCDPQPGQRQPCCIWRRSFRDCMCPGCQPGRR